MDEKRTGRSDVIPLVWEPERVKECKRDNQGCTRIQVMLTLRMCCLSCWRERGGKYTDIGNQKGRKQKHFWRNKGLTSSPSLPFLDSHGLNKRNRYLVFVRNKTGKYYYVSTVGVALGPRVILHISQLSLINEVRCFHLIRSWCLTIDLIRCG